MSRSKHLPLDGVTWRQRIRARSPELFIEAQQVRGQHRVEVLHYYLSGEGKELRARLHSHWMPRAEAVEMAQRVAAILPDQDRWPLNVRDLDRAFRFAFGPDAFGVQTEPLPIPIFPVRCYVRGVRLGPDRTRRSSISTGTRYTILERDGFACRYCGRKAPEVELHVDHVVPVKEGGTEDPGNLVAACRECNQGKGARRSVCVPEVSPDGLPGTPGGAA